VSYLRTPADEQQEPFPPPRIPRNFGPLAGLIFGLLFSGGFWALVYWALYWATHR